MALHLYTSPTVKFAKPNNTTFTTGTTTSSTSKPKPHTLVPDPLRLALLPPSILLGYLLPSVVMTLAAPTTISFSTKQTWTAIQQFWPLWTTLSHELLTIFAQLFDPQTGFESENRSSLLWKFRAVYAFAMTSSASGHLISWLLSALAYLFPTVLFREKYAAQMQPSRIFWPKAPFPPAQAMELADGALWFLQWDQIVGMGSVVLWAMTVRVAAGLKGEGAEQGAEKEEDEGEKMRMFWQWVKGLALMGVVGVVAGPAGAAVGMVWWRDEVVFRREMEGEKKGREKAREKRVKELEEKLAKAGAH
ncbi:MAG: hypothetical protein Q9227_002977 [Pyrenula ochraceoflavens]